MRALFYPKLALDGMHKNRRMTLPYIITGAVMAMMYYILSFLTETPALATIPGGSTLRTMFPLGCVVIGVFSLLFLFYTNSFLIRQRYREFGLYNILGMDKKNIGRLMIWETAFTAAAAITAGLCAGVAFSKAAELILLNLLNMDVSYALSIGPRSLYETARLYIGIYLVLLVNSLLRVRFAKPIELLQSSKTGEKTPRFGWIWGLIGVGLIGWAYYLALSIAEPLKALVVFFAAVVLVILGTYLVFVSGSVAFCRMLQKNKRYYYRPNHFVSVASMVYRMKRNGAGLASICILLTMVLVMLSSTTTLYFSEEDSVRNRYPSGINIEMVFHDPVSIEDENLNGIREKIGRYAPDGTDLEGVRYAMTTGMFTDDGIIVNYENAQAVDYDRVGYLFFISLADYNRMTGGERELGEGECLLYCSRLTTQWETFRIEYAGEMRVCQRLEEFQEIGCMTAMTMPSVYLVVKDVQECTAPLAGRMNDTGFYLMEYEWICGFDCETPEAELEANGQIYEILLEYIQGDKTCVMIDCTSREAEREGFFELYGSLFFLGIMLSIVFLLAAVLLIYYKQISEGYEDQSRFAVMQKVGMTKRDIKKSINSQMLTVFFLPVAAAGLHLVFAFPFITKILIMFAFDNTRLCVLVTLGSFAVLSILYAVVYKITSAAYYAIVSSGDGRQA